jgi:hypothetical protein
MKQKSLIGMVVQLPNCEGTGVILDCTRQRENLYKGTIIISTGEVMIARFTLNKPEVNEPINYKEYHIYNPKNIGGLL